MMRNFDVLFCFFLLVFKFIDSLTFSYLASVQSYVIPTNVYEVNIQAYGGPGGRGFQASSVGGYGGYISCNVNVTVGQTLYILTGGTGVGYSSTNQANAPGYNGGKFLFFLIA